MRQLVVADRVRTATGIIGDAVLVQDGMVAEVGWAAQLRRSGLAEASYPGTAIVPGLGDAHFHPLGYTAAVTRLSLKTVADLGELAERLREAAAELPPGAAIIGSRFDDETLAERRLPTRHDLDRAVAGRPVLLYRYCGHIAVANTAALEAAGITAATPDPEGGYLDRDEAGAPTGVLRETAARLVGDAVGGRATGLAPDDVLRSLRSLAALGLTRIGAIVAAGQPIWCGVGDELATLIEIGPDLPFHLDVLVTADTPEELERAAARLGAAAPRLRFLGWKEFADGSLGGHTAAMHEPFADAPSDRGLLRLVPERAARMAATALGLDGMVAIHAIGDAANDAVLDLFASLLEGGAPPSALRVEHASVLTEGAIERFGRLGVIASVQPAFLSSETDWLPRRLGPERLRWAYPFRSLADAGAVLAGGSDCPVEPPDPLWGLAAARHRGGLVSEESLSGSEALGLFTNGVAQALRRPLPLSPGSPADLTILGGDPVEVAADQVHRLEVVATYVEGRRVEASVEFPWPG